jgi:hypothetical protein
MDDQKAEKSSEIWLKYCEDCVKSKLEKNGDSISNSINQCVEKKA